MISVTISRRNVTLKVRLLHIRTNATTSDPNNSSGNLWTAQRTGGKRPVGRGTTLAAPMAEVISLPLFAPPIGVKWVDIHGVIEAGHVDCGHGAIGCHRPDGRQLFETGQRALGGEGVSVATQEGVGAVHGSKPVQGLVLVVRGNR
jgi:hypothetical protein